MVTGKLARRLERLETSLTAQPETTVILQFRCVRPDGTSDDGPRFVVSFNPLGPKWRDSSRWKRGAPTIQSSSGAVSECPVTQGLLVSWPDALLWACRRKLT